MFLQNIWNDYRGVLGCIQYGDSYLVLRNVRLRCTLAPEDSANLPAKRLSVPDYYAHVFAEYSDKELTETLRIAAGGDEKIGSSESVIDEWGKYKEAQIHGDVDLKKHVDRLVVHERHRPQASWVESIATPATADSARARFILSFLKHSSSEVRSDWNRPPVTS